jgi:hypothetical protein
MTILIYYGVVCRSGLEDQQSLVYLSYNRTSYKTMQPCYTSSEHLAPSYSDGHRLERNMFTCPHC